jgi:5-formyltetrahydrofolate cyclo-ligase
MNKSTKTPWSGRHKGKDRLRSAIWTALDEQDIAPVSPYGHIPSFIGADKAAHLLANLPIWKSAKVIKCNPDTAQLPVRVLAIREGKLLYMAVPRLTREECFIELQDADILSKDRPLEEVLSAHHAINYGRLVTFDEMQPIDLVITGCVAVSRDGGRTGKGAGFADLELGMLREFGLVSPQTPVATTVHPLQIVDSAYLPMQSHDTPLNLIVTPDEIIETNTPYPQPTGLDWNAVRKDQFDTIPILRILKEKATEK